MKIWTSDQVDWILAKYFFAFSSTEKKSRSTKTQIGEVNIQQCRKSLARKIDPGEEGYFLVIGLWGCAAGWGCIFTTGLTTMGLYFH